jgi:adenosine deaminase
MDNLRATIDILFNNTSPEFILNLPHIKSKPLEEVDFHWFVAHVGNKYNVFTNDHISEIYQMLSSQWLHKPGDDDNTKSFLHVLLHFAKDVLTEYNGEPVCKYEQLLRWREISLLIGEDVLSTAFLAHSDEERHTNRYFFSWKPVLTHNNSDIQSIMKKGLAELHFHLDGSTLIFSLNWLSLMNDITGHKKDFDKIKTLLSLNVSTQRGDKKYSLHELVIIAAEIRSILFDFFLNEKNLNGNIKDFPELRTMQIQHNIDALRFLCGKRYGNNKSIIDYAIPQYLSEKEMDEKYFVNSILSGERRFLYDTFRYVYGRSECWRTVEKLFFAYLLIKNIFAREIIQNNKRVGFANFANYQDRKEYFIKKNSVYDKIIQEIAIKSSFANQNLKYLEARITPKESVKEICQKIKSIDDQVLGCYQTVHHKSYTDRYFSSIKKTMQISCSENKNNYPYYFIFHFIKEEDKNKSKYRIRHRDLRNKVFSQAMAIHSVREYYPSIAKRIIAIDAASSEQNARPEVFAQAFRYLRGKKINDKFAFLRNNSVPDLHITYHAGEDYIDIIDGLRAIDETLIFLNLNHCDRLGHALVLGDDVCSYYKRHNKTLTMSQQCFLDNAAWMIHKSSKLGINLSSSVIRFLENNVHRYSQMIYNEIYTSTDFYDAWLLRGDNPYQYLANDLHQKKENSPYSAWSGFDLNDFPQCNLARKNIKACKIYGQYHFENVVKENGDKRVCIKIDENVYDDFIDAVTQIQNAMRREISQQHVSIETNLSSNRKIGGLETYSGHPITKFYDIGLTSESANCQQISASINTDDQGVFSTSIENEFALMAIALEKTEGRKYQPQMIYQWLDNVRENAFAQRFNKDDFECNLFRFNTLPTPQVLPSAHIVDQAIRQ